MAWLVWLLAAAALGVAEFFSLTLAFGILSAAALAAAVSAGAGAAWTIQLLVFAVTAGLGLVVIRPIAVRHMKQPALALDGTDALVGHEATVVEEVSADAGQVKLAGEIWTARPYDTVMVIEPGTQVDVMQIEGATAIVHPRALPLWSVETSSDPWSSREGDR